MAWPYAVDAAMIKSLYRSSRRDISWASNPALACERGFSKLARPDVTPPTIDPASADMVDKYAAFISVPRRGRRQQERVSLPLTVQCCRHLCAHCLLEAVGSPRRWRPLLSQFHCDRPQARNRM